MIISAIIISRHHPYTAVNSAGGARVSSRIIIPRAEMFPTSILGISTTKEWMGSRIRLPIMMPSVLEHAAFLMQIFDGFLKRLERHLKVKAGVDIPHIFLEDQPKLRTVRGNPDLLGLAANRLP